MRGGIGVVIGLDFHDDPSDAAKQQRRADQLGRNLMNTAVEEALAKAEHLLDGTGLISTGQSNQESHVPNPRWKIKPAGSTWGDFGPDDQLGRLNLVTPEKVKQGVAEVREGRSFCLSMPLDYPGGNILNPRRNPPVLSPTQRGGKPNMTYPLSREDPKLVDIVCDDVVLLTLQYSTQWDTLAHVGQEFDVDGDGKREMVFYNGFRAGEHVIGPVDYRGGKETATGGHKGATRLGVENMARSCVQGRAVMIDLLAHFGRPRKMVGYDDPMSGVEKEQGVVEKGDI